MRGHSLRLGLFYNETIDEQINNIYITTPGGILDSDSFPPQQVWNHHLSAVNVCEWIAVVDSRALVWSSLVTFVLMRWFNARNSRSLWRASKFTKIPSKFLWYPGYGRFRTIARCYLCWLTHVSRICFHFASFVTMFNGVYQIYEKQIVRTLNKS